MMIIMIMIIIIMIIMSMFWDYISDLRPPTGLLFTARLYMSMENHIGMIWQGKTPDSSTGALWQSYRKIYLVAKQEKLVNEMMNFALRSISFILQRFFNMP
jgi:hypothetical protein